MSNRANRDADRENGHEHCCHRLVRAQRILDERRKQGSKDSANRPEETDCDDGQVEPRDVHCRTDQPVGSANDVPVELEGRRILLRWRRRNLLSGDPARNCREHNPDGSPLIGNDTADDRPEQDRDIGSRFNQSRSTEHVILAQMLGEDCIFDGAEEC